MSGWEQTTMRVTVPVPPDDLWARAERAVLCTCGLLAVGYRASWAVSHTDGCPVTTAYHALIVAAAHRSVR